MITSEFEYHLISELITMPDRELAQKIELHIWYKCSTPQPRILGMYLKALIASTEPEEFYEAARKIINDSGGEHVAVDVPGGTALGRTPSYLPPKYVEIKPEQMIAAEKQQPPLEDY